MRSQGWASEESKKVLFAIKNELMAHLKKEDTVFYPVLRRKAETDEKIKGLLEQFSQEMSVISKGAMDFFEKYLKPDATLSGIEFGKDIGKLCYTLDRRIHKEEEIIYVEFDRVK